MRTILITVCAATIGSASAEQLPRIVPLFNSSTSLEPSLQEETSEALVTRVGDRVRDRHAREERFQAYDHYLSFYWEERSFQIEIVDKIAKGGDEIVFTLKSLSPLNNPDFRFFYKGGTTVAEYHHNVAAEEAKPNHYTATITHNPIKGRPLRVGSKVEFEFSPFLDSPANGRSNYYGTAMLYVVGRGIMPWEGRGENLDSYPLPKAALLGGQTTLHRSYSDEPANRFKQMAGNIAPLSAQPFLLGRRLHHTDFGTGEHSEQPNPGYAAQAGKLGPRFVATSCISCHHNNGRALPPKPGGQMLRSVIKSGAQYGGALQPRSVHGKPEARGGIARWQSIQGNYGDGAGFELRKPVYTFTGKRPDRYSVRLAPQLVGLGLLEAIKESDVLTLADPDDKDGDGISGRPQIVTNQTGSLRLGRFGYEAGEPTVRHQVAAALNSDMGVTTSIFPQFEDSPAGEPELSDAALANLTRYIALLGVNPSRELDNPKVRLGERLFADAGCATCHTPKFTTSTSHPFAELRGQSIQPYTDLLLHDMGPGLADNLGEHEATGAEWRTAPLWSIGLTAGVSGGEAYLHDGRARSLEEAILWHGGEGEAAKEAFRTMDADERAALVRFLKSR